MFIVVWEQSDGVVRFELFRLESNARVLFDGLREKAVESVHLAKLIESDVDISTLACLDD